MPSVEKDALKAFIDVIRWPVKGRGECRATLISALKAVEFKVNKLTRDTALKAGCRIARLGYSKARFAVYIVLACEKLRKIVGRILGLPTFYQPGRSDFSEGLHDKGYRPK